MVIRLLLSIYLSFSSIGLAESVLYDSQDLDVLTKNKNYREYLDHAMDLKPSKRDQKWEAQLEEMGLQYLDFISAQRKTNIADIERVKKISHFKVFYSNEFFIKKRDYYFLKNISECLAKNEANCKTKVDNYFLDFKHDILFSKDLVNLLKAYPKSFDDLWPYAKPLVQNTLSEFYCDKSPIKELVIERLMSAIDLNALKKSIHKDCIKVVTPHLKSFLTDKNSEIRDKAFSLMFKNENLKIEDKGLYSTYSFLSKSSLSNTEVDSIIKTFKNLKNNYEIRTKVLRELKSWPHFPDSAFSQEDAPIKIKVINRYFPEILDYYSSTCLDYLKGRKTFTRGNPTPQCHRFFHSISPLNILSETKLHEYQEATKYRKN